MKKKKPRKQKKENDKKEQEWFVKAWEESKRLEAQKKAGEIKYLVRRLYEPINN